MATSLDTPVIAPVRNSQWVRNAFFAPRLDSDDGRHSRRAYNSAKTKFYDTSLGGNKSLNPIFALNPMCDPVEGGIYSGSSGMGPFYSEAYDDNQQVVSFQFGAPKFNALSTYFSNYWDPNMSAMVKNGGVIERTAFTAGRLAGTLVTLPFQAFFGINALYNRVGSTLSGKPYSRFYYMEPTMPLYWNTVQNLANLMAANMFMAPSLKPDDPGDTNAASNRYGDGHQAAASMSAMAQLMPDVFDASYGVNVYAMATKAQRLADAHHDNLSQLAKSADYHSGVMNYFRSKTLKPNAPQLGDFNSYIESYLTRPTAKDIDNKEITADLSIQPDATVAGPGAPSPVRKDDTSIADFLRAEVRDGAAFVRLRCNYQGEVSDSFSNSTKQAPLAEKINSISQTARDLSNTFAGGNLADNFVANTAEGIVAGLGTFLSGAASSVGFTAAGAIGAGVMAEMPDVWESSSAEFSSSQYEFKLTSPYGDKVSVFTNIFIPLACLLAGALPRATGKASHGAPFLCRVYSQGMTDIRLGMISDITISRGGSNLGYSVDMLPTQVNVSVTVKNMNSVMTVAMSDSVFGDAIGFSAFDEDTALTEYLSAMSGLSLYDQYYALNRLELAFAKTSAQWNSLTSPATVANYIGGTFPGRVMSAVAAQGFL